MIGAALYRLAGAGCQGACSQGRMPERCDCYGSPSTIEARMQAGMAPISSPDEWAATQVEESTTMAGLLDGQAPAPLPWADPATDGTAPAATASLASIAGDAGDAAPWPYTAGDLAAAALIAALVAALVWAASAPPHQLLGALARLADALGVPIGGAR